MGIKFFKHWVNNPRQLIIIILGYVITILVISMFIGDIQNKLLTYNQLNFGDKNKRSAVYLHTSPDKNYSYNTEDILKHLGKSGEVDILTTGTETLKKDKKQVKTEITPVYYEKQPDWQPLIYAGRHFTPSECINNSKCIVIGLKVAESLNINITDKISFYGTKYTVVGIMGRKNLENNFDEAVYIPLGALPKEYINKLEQNTIKKNENNNNYLDINILFRVNSAEIKSVLDDLSNIYKKNTFSYDLYDNVYTTITFSEILAEILIICVPIMIVALINVSNISVLWILNRRKELCIKKVLGATDRYIQKSIELDMITVAVISALIATLLQEALFLIIEPIANNYDFTFNLTWINFITALILSFIIGYLASIIPFEKTMEMNPSEVLKAE